MILSFMEWAKRKDAKRIFVTATLLNNSAINFYEKMGFEKLNITLKKKID